MKTQRTPAISRATTRSIREARAITIPQGTRAMMRKPAAASQEFMVSRSPFAVALGPAPKPSRDCLPQSYRPFFVARPGLLPRVGELVNEQLAPFFFDGDGNRVGGQGDYGEHQGPAGS